MRQCDLNRWWMETERRPGALGSGISVCVCVLACVCVSSERKRGSHYLLIISSFIPSFFLSSLCSPLPPPSVSKFFLKPPPAGPAPLRFSSWLLESSSLSSSINPSFLQHLPFFLPSLTVFNLPGGCVLHTWSYTMHLCHSVWLKLYIGINL